MVIVHSDLKKKVKISEYSKVLCLLVRELRLCSCTAGGFTGWTRDSGNTARVNVLESSDRHHDTEMLNIWTGMHSERKLVIIKDNRILIQTPYFYDKLDYLHQVLVQHGLELVLFFL